MVLTLPPTALCRSPCGERGLKLQRPARCLLHGRRSPCGERGLKSIVPSAEDLAAIVAPRAGSVD